MYLSLAGQRSEDLRADDGDIVSRIDFQNLLPAYQGGAVVPARLRVKSLRREEHPFHIAGPVVERLGLAGEVG